MFLDSSNILYNPLVQLVLCIPVYVIGIIYFGKSAFGSLKIGVPNMDVLIFIGSTSAFFYSLYGWWLFQDTDLVRNYLFFETTATIITLVLLGNVLEHKSVKKTTSAFCSLTRATPLLTASMSSKLPAWMSEICTIRKPSKAFGRFGNCNVSFFTL